VPETDAQEQGDYVLRGGLRHGIPPEISISIKPM